MLFVLVMDALNAFFWQAEIKGIFRPLGHQPIKSRVSMYVDDLVLFLSPIQQDLVVVKAILDAFACASGLHTNDAKCQVTHIRCDETHMETIQRHFPCKYLGVPLHIHNLHKCDLQRLVDSVANRIPAWKGKLLASSGQVLLTKVSLAAIPVHMAIAVALQPYGRSRLWRN